MPKRKVGSTKPKGAKTAYAFFVQSCKGDVDSAAEKSVKLVEFVKSCALKWKALGNEEKIKFQILADEDKKRYLEEMKDYHPEDDVKLHKKRKNSSSDHKRPKSSYIFFCSDRRDEVRTSHPEWAMPLVSKELGKIWQKLSSVEKDKYKKLADEDKLRCKEYNLKKQSDDEKLSSGEKETKVSTENKKVMVNAE